VADVLDAGTLVVLLCAGCFCFGLIALSGQGWRDHSIRHWGVGYLLAGFGLVLYVLRGVAPDLLSIQGANSLMLLGIGLMLSAIMLYTQQTQFKPVVVAWVVVSIVGFNLISSPPIEAVRLDRVLFLSAVVALSQGLAIFMLLRSSLDRTSLMHILIATHVALMAVFGFRAVYLVIKRFDTGGFLLGDRMPEVGTVIFFFIALTFVFLQGPTYMLIRKEDSDRQAAAAKGNLKAQLTERSLEQRFYESRLRTERAETIEHFARGVAHDGNNVIGVLQLGMGELRERLAKGRPVPSDMLDLMDKSLNQARVTIAGLRALSCSKPPTLTPLDIRSVCEEVVGTLVFSLPSAVHVSTDINADLIATTHRAFLLTALLNLGRNGAEAMGSAGGELRISARQIDAIPRGDKQIGSISTRPLIDIAIVDNGPGISNDMLATAFEPMITSKPQADGHGYGLYMVRAITERLGAALVVQTSEQKGTTVHFLLAQGDSDEHATCGA